MTNLKLVTTETFGNVPCDFYRNVNDDILLTREQIGTALEYSDPSKAIQKIHLKHKDRLEPLCLRTKEIRYPQSGGAGIEVETIYYTERGIMEICRWSSKPLADKFMDWCWDIVEKYRHNQGFTDSNTKVITDTLNTLNTTLSIIQEEVKQFQKERVNLSIAAKKVNGNTTPSLFSRSMFPKYRAIEDYFGYSRKELYHKLYLTIQKFYGIDLNNVKDTYCMENGLQDCFLMDAVESRKDLREKLEYVVQKIIEKWGIYYEEDDCEECFELEIR